MIDISDVNVHTYAGFETASERLRKPLFNFIHDYLENYDDAEDAVQQTFLKAYRNIDKFDGSKPFVPWVWAIAHNTATDILRKRGRSVDYMSLDDIEFSSYTLPTINEIPETVAVSNDMLSRIAHLSGELTTNQRLIITLACYHGLSMSEISDVFGMSVNAVKSCLHRGRISLRRKLAEAGMSL